MPKKMLDKEKLLAEILTYISRHGVSSSQSLCQLFEISQSTLSRMISASKDAFIVIGKARGTKYAVQRKITDTVTSIPIYEVDFSSRGSL